MGQQEILKVVERKGVWITTEEVYKKLKIKVNKGNVARSLQKLFKQGLLDRIERGSPFECHQWRIRNNTGEEQKML